MRRSAITIDAALKDKALLGAALGDPATWAAWLVILRAAFGLPLDEEQAQIFAKVAGGRAPLARRARELWAIVGRGGGKSRMAAAIAVFIALLTKHKLSPGETGYVLVLSQTVSQARTVFGYALGFIEQSPLLKKEVIDTTAFEIRLRHNITIAVHPNNFRSIRGRTLLACIFDETAFWRDATSTLPDVETYRAVLPSLIRTGGPLVGISTPYRKLGLLHDKYRKHFGQDDADVLVVQGNSIQFNPTLSSMDIAEAMASDPEAGASEWEGTFRNDIGAFLADTDVERGIDFDRPAELPPRPKLSYFAFVDPSGGRHDAFAIAIAHKEEDERVVIDVIRGRYPPFDPQETVKEYAQLLREYHITSVTGDNYSAEWVMSAFKSAGIKYERSTMSKSQLYLEGLPLFTRGLVTIPNHARLLRELRLLERRPHSGGRDSVDHGRNGSDDLANATFGCLRQVVKPKPKSFGSSFVTAGLAAPYGLMVSATQPAEPRSRVRFVLRDELGNEVTPEEASLIGHGLHPRQRQRNEEQRRLKEELRKRKLEKTK